MNEVRAAGFRGAGVRVAVISTGVYNLASYQAAGALPASVYVAGNARGTLDEGSWMLELVHQHAPDAALGFCDGLDLDFAGCIRDLAVNFRADIIVDDMLFAGQYYPDGTARLISDLEAANDRLVFVHLAGNEQAGGYWQGAFVPATVNVGGKTRTVLDFGAASGGASDPYQAVALPAETQLTLIVNWNDPPHGAGNHALTGYLLDVGGTVLAQASAQDNPALTLRYRNELKTAQTILLVLAVEGDATAGLAVQITEGARTCNIECQTLTYASAGLAGGTVGDIPDVLVVGATQARSPLVLERWSNHGPFRLDFLADTRLSGAGFRRLSIPLAVPKPDLVAPDCVTVGFSDGVSLEYGPFCGTSAAAPAIAAAAALLESAGFDRLRVLRSLRGTALPLGSARWDPAYGYGLADAAAAWRNGGR
jgi:Subtilase family